MKKKQTELAFSLVEVVMAIAITSFCMLTLIGLLPVGLSAINSSREQAAAAVTIEQMADAIRTANPQSTNSDGSITYMGSGSYTNLTWTTSGANVANTYNNVSLGGLPTTTAVTDARLIARVQIIPPSSPVSSGAALISVAWPAHATWNPAATNWNNAEGSLSTWLIFTPGH